MDLTFYNRFRSDIIHMRLRPGMFFSIKDVCDTYEIGRSPAREALIRLEQEGLIQFLPQKGTEISRISLKRAGDERFLRNSIETQVMEEFLNCDYEPVLDELRSCVRRQKESYDNQDFRAFMDLDDEFHGIFYRETGREFCQSIVEAQSGHYRRVRLLSATDEGINHEIIKEHERLIEALEQRNFQEAREIFAGHLGKLRQQEQFLVEHFPDLFEGEGETEEKRSSSVLRTDFLSTVSETVHEI